jgi:hypothetical protein
MGLAVAWADRELDGWLLDVFYETVDLEALGTEAAELKKIGERCPEFRRCVGQRGACQKTSLAVINVRQNAV